MRNFDACCLCLQTAREPLACLKGHIACKECIYENILAQKKEISRQQKALQDFQSQSHQDERHQLAQEETQRIAAFTQAQSISSVIGVNSSSIKPAGQHSPSGTQKDGKAKSTLGSKTGNFWVPSQTPEAKATAPTAQKTEVTCPLGDDHTIAIKKLLPVVFTVDKSSKLSICPACSKNLSNALKMVIVRSCGHVVCRPCCEKFMKPTHTCFVCEVKCKDKDMIPLDHEGTGYASTSQVDVKRYDLPMGI